MKKKIAIIGAGISGLVFANFLKKNSEYSFTIYEKNSSLDLFGGYGVQLSINSVSILNKIGFGELNTENKFYPEKIDFYSPNTKKICELDITQFNRQDIRYTTLKRSLLVEFLKEKLFADSIQFNKKIRKIDYSDTKVEITFENSATEIFDYLIVADGVFSLTKSILFKTDIKPVYSGSFAIRAIIRKEKLNFLNEKNISIFFGHKFHLVAYALNTKNEFNLVAMIRKSSNHESSLNDEGKLRQFIKDSLIHKNSKIKDLFDNASNIKCFPTFTSDKIRHFNNKNIFFLGDAFYASLPTFAQGASQSIESAYELFNTLNENNPNNYFDSRVERVKMINRRARLNYFIFHLSNPFFVLIRNLILKIFVNNKSFLNKYLGQIYTHK